MAEVKDPLEMVNLGAEDDPRPTLISSFKKRKHLMERETKRT